MNNHNNPITPEERLMAHSDEFRQDLIKIMDNIYFAVGFGASNSILIEGENGSILVDTLESIEGAEVLKEKFKKVSSKPIRMIIYTHSHVDHIGGTSVFMDENHPEILCREPSRGLLGANELSNIFSKRANRQFGVALSSKERVNIGLGPGDANLAGMGNGYVPAPRQFSTEKLSITVEGIQLELIAAPGETEDQLFVWLPEQKVLISADNYYKSFPNLYAIRGTSYRDIAVWVESIDKMIALDPQYLLPGHSRLIVGGENIKAVLTDYRDAIEFVLKETLNYINQGLTPDELVEVVKLPARLANKPYLQEFYGTIEWSVRAIYTGYLGWFDGNPKNLFPISPKNEAKHMADLAGGADILFSKAQSAVAQREFQWALQLADYLLALGDYVLEAKNIKIQSCRALAHRQISASGRNYYFAYAQEMERGLLG